jgi:arsenate reductase (thioredoxin)
MFRVLFICIHNSARSQMAEAWLNHLGNGNWIAESAGLSPWLLNPRVTEVMLEAGIDISQHKTKSVDDILQAKRTYDFVITVCEADQARNCPHFPGEGERLAWYFDNPSEFKGTDQEILNQIRAVRDQIESKIRELMDKHFFAS